MPSAPAAPRGPAALRLLASFAADHGIDGIEVLAGTGLDLAALRDPQTVVEAEQELTATRNVIRRIGGDARLGEELGRRWSLSTFRDLGFAMLAAPTGRDALAIGLRHLGRTSAAISLRIEEHEHEVVVLLDESAVPEDVREFLAARDTAVIRTVWSVVFGTPLPALRRVARGAVLHLPRELVDGPLPHSDAEVAAELDRRLSEENALRAAQGTFERRVRDRLRLDPAASQRQVAAALGVAPRTLRRRLAAEGASFEALGDEVRAAVAMRLLSTGATVEEVARRVGYAEAASFTRAFRRWTVTTPGAVRRRRRPSPGGPQGGEVPRPPP